MHTMTQERGHSSGVGSILLYIGGTQWGGAAHCMEGESIKLGCIGGGRGGGTPPTKENPG